VLFEDFHLYNARHFLTVFLSEKVRKQHTFFAITSVMTDGDGVAIPRSLVIPAQAGIQYSIVIGGDPLELRQFLFPCHCSPG
jgi:hypothetical protein